MKFIYLLCCVIIHNITHTMIVKDPKLKIPEYVTETNIQEYLPAYNPFSIYVPSKEFLAQLTPDRVLDMGGLAYGRSMYTKSMYFYTNALELFPNDINVVTWANYEVGYIYYVRKKKEKAIEYFTKVIEHKGVPVSLNNLAKSMLNRIVYEKEYKRYLKQEDLLFVEDKKARAELNKQIAKEERSTERIRRQLEKERKQREKEEKKAEKAAEKERKAAEKAAEKEAMEAE